MQPASKAVNLPSRRVQMNRRRIDGNMSHKPKIFSLPGTPLLDRTVGELVAERPGRSRIFQTFKIDFCCQGSRTLREACERSGVETDAMLELFDAESANRASSMPNPAELPIDKLIDYIVQTHHRYLRSELPRLYVMAERVAHVHGRLTPALVEIYRTFTDLAAELATHIAKEEQVLFPAILAMGRGEQAPENLEAPIASMFHEHEEVGTALGTLRDLSRGFRPPAGACNTYRTLFTGLQDLEEDLHQHIHLENAVLFPTVEAIVARYA
jgi:regulator of cell morphogenesis and NO signaling